MPRTYLPKISNQPTVEGQDEGVLSNAQVFIDIWMSHLGKRSSLMVMSDKLNRCAFLHATYLNSRTQEEIEALPDDGHGSHTGQDNSTPNQRVRAAGYLLPEWHGDGNTVEFNVRTHKGPFRALELYLGSDAHRPALLGEGFWEPATVFGVANVGDDWVVLVCPPEV